MGEKKKSEHKAKVVRDLSDGPKHRADAEPVPSVIDLFGEVGAMADRRDHERALQRTAMQQGTLTTVARINGALAGAGVNASVAVGLVEGEDEDAYTYSVFVGVDDETGTAKKA